MATIQLLDQNTINKIAAGEVVERPASVIKELVENAIDADADRITIEVKDGGLKLIRITDNGIGIAKNQIRTAFLRHSTSKIQKETDLISIASLGFRGEALASIASVSMVELITKEAAELTGVRYLIEGGNEKSLEEIGCPVGTSFIIRDLFYNTPARLKFMKTPSTELGYISDLVNKLAMGHPGISFKLVSNNKVKLHTSGNNKLNECIYNVYGKEVASNLIEINHKNETMEIHGYMGKPHISRGNRSYENYYINGRYIKSKVIEKAIEDAFKSKLMLHRYPFVTFHLTILSKEVDVNVHPTKMEVRFANEASIYQLVLQSVEGGFNAQELIPDVDVQDKKVIKDVIEKQPEPFEIKRLSGAESNPVSQEGEIPNKIKETYLAKMDVTSSPTPTIDLMNLNPKTYKEALPSTKDTLVVPDKIVGITPIVKETDVDYYKGNQVELEKTAFTDSSAVKSHKIIGQLFDTYWIVELEEKYYMIDQHAAHEKVLYERMLKKIETKLDYGQRLLRPVVVDLSIQEMARYNEHETLFADLGFEVELFGEESLIIRTVPFIFDKVLDSGQFLQILDGLEGTFSEDKYGVLLDDIASMSCKAAIKGNNRLSKAEYIQLIDDLLTLDNPFHCPHGRPTIISMSQYELEKKFKRIQ